MAGRFLTLHELSDRTGLPTAWLLREADAGRLPCIRAGLRRMFDPDAVRKSLAVNDSGTGPKPNQPGDADLEALIAAWPTLPMPIKAGIMAMVRACSGA